MKLSKDCLMLGWERIDDPSDHAGLGVPVSLAETKWGNLIKHLRHVVETPRRPSLRNQDHTCYKRHALNLYSKLK